MIPLFQTRFGKIHGNCYQACLASILELPLVDVPDFCNQYINEEWLTEVIKWTQETCDLSYISVDWTKTAEIWLKDCWHIMNGKSPRGNFVHSVVGYSGKMVHDPYPSGDGLETIDNVDIFIAKNPASYV